MELQNIYTEVIEELKCVVGCSNNNSELQIFANAVKIDRCAQKLLKSVRTKFIDVLGGEENSFHEETLFDIIKKFFVEDTTTTTPVKSSPKQTSKITMATTTTTKAAAAAEVPVHKKSFHKPAAATATTSSNLTPIVVAPRPVVVPLPVPKLPPPPPPPAITTTEEEEDNNNKRKRGRRPKNEKRSMKYARQQLEKDKKVREILFYIEKKDYASAYAIAHVYAGLKVDVFRQLLGKNKPNTCSICRTTPKKLYPMYPCGCDSGVQVCKNCVSEYVKKLFQQIDNKKMGVKALHCACCTEKHKDYIDLNIKFYKKFWAHVILTAQMGRTQANGEKMEMIIKWLLQSRKMFNDEEYEELKKKYKKWHQQNAHSKKHAAAAATTSTANNDDEDDDGGDENSLPAVPVPVIKKTPPLPPPPPPPPPPPQQTENNENDDNDDNSNSSHDSSRGSRRSSGSSHDSSSDSSDDDDEEDDSDDNYDDDDNSNSHHHHDGNDYDGDGEDQTLPILPVRKRFKHSISSSSKYDEEEETKTAVHGILTPPTTLPPTSPQLKSSLPDDLPDLSPPAGIKELERFETFSFNSLPKWSSSSSGGGDKMEF